MPGLRTDWHACQWLQFLHSVGLLRAAFRPDGEVCAVRSLMRHRSGLVEMTSQHIRDVFRMAAYSLHRESPLGDYLRWMKSKLGPARANVATAHKIAVIFYTM